MGTDLAEYKYLIENEALVLSRLKHKNIVTLCGMVKSKCEIVVEALEIGNLPIAVEMISFTRDNLLKLLDDIAAGMEYVIDNKYLHRNLMCVNILLGKKKICKIGEFLFAAFVGDTNGIYVEKGLGPPGAPQSPETIFTKKFTVANEVWGMGIVCWELFYITENSGQLPPALATKQMHISNLHTMKMQLPKSKLCPDKLHRYIVNDLLNEDPAKRPNFTDIRMKLKEIASEKSD